jgi:anti-sigma B factor antagonist
VAGETVTVVMTGEADLTSAPALAARLNQILDDQPRHLVFDMSRVGFIDVAAARLIAGAARSLPPGRRPVLRSPSPLVLRVLELTGLEDQFELDP